MDKKRVLLVQPPLLQFEVGGDWTPPGTTLFPMGIMYLAETLLEQGYTVDFFDFSVEAPDWEDLGERVRASRFVGFSVFSAALHNVKELIGWVRRIAPDAFVLCGGPYCDLTNSPVPEADVSVVGEAESAIARLLDGLENGNVPALPGVIDNSNGEPRRTPGRMEAETIDKGLRRALALVRNKEYFRFGRFKLPGIVAVLASRGCPHHCSYCTHKGVIPYRKRSIDAVVADLRAYAAAGYRYIYFSDDSIVVDKKRTHRLLDRLIEERLHLKLVAEARADAIDEGLARKMRRAGFGLLMFGIESANQDVLDFYNKRLTIAEIERAIQVTNQAGLVTGGFFIVGAPMETEEHFAGDLRLINDSRLDFAHFSILFYYQGSVLWDDAVAQGRITAAEPIAVADQRTTHFATEELEMHRNALRRAMYGSGRRWLRIIWKFIRLGEWPVLLRVALAFGGDFTRFVSGLETDDASEPLRRWGRKAKRPSAG